MDEMIQKLGRKLSEFIPQENLLFGELLKNHTTFRIGGPADLYIRPDRSQLKQALALAKEYKVPVCVIGNGSNLLVSDAGIRGLVIEIGRPMDETAVCGNCLTVGAGTLLSKAAAVAADAGLGRLEFAAGIPGSAGGAVVMNAGAYGGEMKDVVASVTVLTPEGEEEELSVDDLELSYRHSCIPARGYIVLSVSFRLSERNPGDIRAVMAELRERRIEKQPLEYPSAGSTFKRPQGYFAGKLIMDAGLAGYCVGDAQVSAKHCGFVINRGNATAAEVCQLIAEVKEKVFEQFQVALEPEVKMVGEGMNK